MKTKYGRTMYKYYPEEWLNEYRLSIKKGYITENAFDKENSLNIEVTRPKTYSTNTYLQNMELNIILNIKLASNGQVAMWVKTLFEYEIYCKSFTNMNNPMAKKMIYYPYIRMDYLRAIEIAKETNTNVISEPSFSKGKNILIKEEFIADHIDSSKYWYNINYVNKNTAERTIVEIEENYSRKE